MLYERQLAKERAAGASISHGGGIGSGGLPLSSSALPTLLFESLPVVSVHLLFTVVCVSRFEPDLAHPLACQPTTCINHSSPVHPPALLHLPHPPQKTICLVTRRSS